MIKRGLLTCFLMASAIAVLPESANAQTCYNSVQGKVAWDYSNHKNWSPNNVRSICTGAENSQEPAKCFARAMHGLVSQPGGDTNWRWTEARDLCQGVTNASATIQCYEQEVVNGNTHAQASERCGSRGQATPPISRRSSRPATPTSHDQTAPEGRRVRVTVSEAKPHETYNFKLAFNEICVVRDDDGGFGSRLSEDNDSEELTLPFAGGAIFIKHKVTNAWEMVGRDEFNLQYNEEGQQYNRVYTLGEGQCSPLSAEGFFTLTPKQYGYDTLEEIMNDPSKAFLRVSAHMIEQDETVIPLPIPYPKPPLVMNPNQGFPELDISGDADDFGLIEKRFTLSEARGLGVSRLDGFGYDEAEAYVRFTLNEVPK